MNEVKVTFYKSPGNGGQHKNCTLAATRLQYRGYKVECGESRDQFRNKEIAFVRLRDLITKDAKVKSEKIVREQITAQNPNCGRRGDYERNYNYKRNEVTQGDKKIRLDDFFRGNLDGLYEK